MGTGLRQNMGVEWCPQVWKNTTNASPNRVFTDAVDCSAKRMKKDTKEKILRKPKKVEEAMPRQITQLQLVVLIAGTTMVLRQKKLLMTSPQNIWSN